MDIGLSRPLKDTLALSRGSCTPSTISWVSSLIAAQETTDGFLLSRSCETRPGDCHVGKFCSIVVTREFRKTQYCVLMAKPMKGAAKNAIEDLETLRKKHLSLLLAEKGLMIDQFS